MEIAALLSIEISIASRQKWRNFCCASLFVTLFDVLVAASLVLALFSPLRWKLIGGCSYSRSTYIEYRMKVFGHCLQCLRDMVCTLVGSLCLLSFTGEWVGEHYVSIEEQSILPHTCNICSVQLSIPHISIILAITIIIRIVIITSGRQVTMYYLYDSLHRELDQTTEYSLRLDQYMYRLFSSGVSSGLDLVVLVAMMPSLLFAPSTWYTGGSHCLHEYM